MAYIAYPIAKAKAPYGDIYHDHLPVVVTTVAEYEETLGQRHEDFGCVPCNTTDPLVITLGCTRCGVWLEGKVLLDELPCRTEDLIHAFDLDDA